MKQRKRAHGRGVIKRALWGTPVRRAVTFHVAAYAAGLALAMLLGNGKARYLAIQRQGGMPGYPILIRRLP